MNINNTIDNYYHLYYSDPTDQPTVDCEEYAVSPPPKNTDVSQRLGSMAAGADANSRNVRSEINSRALLAGTDCIAIRHGECVYWLRATRQGKLLLTK